MFHFYSKSIGSKFKVLDIETGLFDNQPLMKVGVDELRVCKHYLSRGVHFHERGDRDQIMVVDSGVELLDYNLASNKIEKSTRYVTLFSPVW